MASISIRSLTSRARLFCRKTRLSPKSLNVAYRQQTVIHILHNSNRVTPCLLQQARLLTTKTPSSQQNREINESSSSSPKTDSSLSGTSDTRQSTVSRDSTETQTEVPSKAENESESSIGIFKRFRNAYKEHGKVLVGVHLVTSSVWISVFYYAAASGLDITPLLLKIGVSDSVIQYLGSAVGNLATAYVMYKIATPARYTVTIFGTYTTVKYLRKWGYMAPPHQEDNIRSLMKEKYSDIKDDVKDKLVDMKDDVRDKYDDLKDDVKDKIKGQIPGIKKKQS